MHDDKSFFNPSANRLHLKSEASFCLSACGWTSSHVFLFFVTRFSFCAFRVAGGWESQQVKLLQLQLSAQTHGQPPYSGKHTHTTAAHVTWVTVKCFTLMATGGIILCRNLPFQHFVKYSDLCTHTHTHQPTYSHTNTRTVTTQLYQASVLFWVCWHFE